MTHKLRLAPDLLLPEDVVTSTIVIYGGKGMGKTNLGSVIVEELQKAHLRWSVLDPMGVFWGLRYTEDGKGPGIECVILGGPHGDIPIEPTSGAIVADFVIDEDVNTIIDFSRKPSGLMWGKGEKVRFVTDYALRLFQRQGELVGGRRREPIFQILDEAARYIPQTIPAGSFDLAQCVGAWEQAAEEGRNIGLGVCFLTQRSARMNKSVSELADVMFAFRTIGPNSLAAIVDWLGEHIEKTRVRDVAAKVRELEIGQALVVSPGWLRLEKVVKLRARETFDSSATPKPGQRGKKVTGQAAKPDLAKYRERMAATIEKAEADDPKKLRKLLAEKDSRIRQLEKAPPAKANGKAAPDQAAIDRAVAAVRRVEFTKVRKALEAAMKFIVNLSTQGFDVAGVDKAELQKALEAAVGRATQIIDGRVATRQRQIAQLQENAKRIAQLLKAALSDEDVTIELSVTKTEPFAVSAPRQAPPRPAGRSPAEQNGEFSITPSKQRILDALAAFEQLGIRPAKRVNVAFFAGYTENGHFNNMVGELRTQGLLDYPSGNMVQLTEAGLASADASANAIQSLDDLHNTWLKKLSPSEGKLLRVLIERGVDNPISRADLAVRTGYTENGHFNNMVGHLRSLGAADYPGGGTVVATDVLFPEGLV